MLLNVSFLLPFRRSKRKFDPLVHGKGDHIDDLKRQRLDGIRILLHFLLFVHDNCLNTSIQVSFIFQCLFSVEMLILFVIVNSVDRNIDSLFTYLFKIFEDFNY